MASTLKSRTSAAVFPKAATGIDGFDTITGGGLPKGRPSLICGTAGCGKTLFAMEFLVRGATQFNEPGVFMAFEETANELTQNVRSLGFDLDKLTRTKKLLVDYVHIERAEIQETGEFDLEGLFIRLNHAIDSIGARRVVLDTIEALFSGLPNEMILRAELRRLFRWLKEKGVSAVITAERGDGTLTRYGLEEYVADCVILLDHRVHDQLSTRRLRVVKYRGSLHGTNEYPFLIGSSGIAVLPITSLGLAHPASSQRISSGIARLDQMLGGKGFYRGSSVLTSGSAGTGKTTLASAFCAAACARGERALYFSFEESPEQIQRNMRAVGIDMRHWVNRGLLQFHSSRPTFQGLEMHLVSIHESIKQFSPDVVVFDPITNLTSVGSVGEVRAMLTRLIDLLKTSGITAMFNSLTAGGMNPDQTEVGVSSLMDAWLLVRNLEHGGERNRALYILKSRGMAHSNQVREFLITSNGIDLFEPYLGNGQVLTGSARLAQEARERAEAAVREQQAEQLRLQLEQKRISIENQLAALQSELRLTDVALKRESRQHSQRMHREQTERIQMARLRGAASNGNGKKL